MHIYSNYTLDDDICQPKERWVFEQKSPLAVYSVNNHNKHIILRKKYIVDRGVKKVKIVICFLDNINVK